MTDFFQALQKEGNIKAPTKMTDKNHSFQQVESIDEISLSYTRTMIPPKKFFIPQKEAIFTFDIQEESYDEPKDIDEQLVLLGVHSCDINALNLLDKVFMTDLPDKYYFERRKNTFLVGVSCQPDEHCFCKSMGTSYAREGFDLFLHDIGDRYLVRVGTEKANRFSEKNDGLFEDSSQIDFIDFRKAEKKFLDSFQLELETHGLQDFLDMSYDSEVWSEYGDRCLSCGSCNLVCPRCRCYDVHDELNLDMNTGERIRKWYSCMLIDHGLVAGGHNFRPSSGERIRNRFNCKGSLREDLPNCVGCGRCTTFCPADIDFVEVMKKVRGEL
jgi:sulfhydrogenase subunit beta (sulfur reductase)